MTNYLSIHSKVQLAFLATQLMFSMALNNVCFSCASLMYVSKSKLYISNKPWKSSKSGS